MSLTDLDPAHVKLRQILKFTGDDLYENQQGLMSEAQKQHLLNFIKKRFFYGLLGLFGTGLFFYFVVVRSTVERRVPPELVVLYFGALLAFFAVVGLFRWWRVISDVRGGVVKTIRGEARFSEIGATIKVRVLKIDNKNITVENGNVGAFEEGKTYIVYCAPRIGNVLSAEIVETP
jgi:hypothetical protein